jgi:uncharacterized protein (DUF1810 family)
MSDLTRFHEAQARHLDTALAELRAGAKRSHWIWFVFPQLAGLGRSETARHYGIHGLDHARAYLADPVLAVNLDAAFAALLRHAGRDPEAILGPVDALKLRSCATLFAAAGSDRARDALDAFYGGRPDPATQAMLA